MGRTRLAYPPEFREQMVALVRSGRNPEELAADSTDVDHPAQPPPGRLEHCFQRVEFSVRSHKGQEAELGGQNDFRARPEDLRMIPVDGDSLELLLSSGNHTLIDVSQRVPVPPGLFVIWDGMGLVAKRIEHVPRSEPPKVVIKSVNPEYASYKRFAEEVRLVGRTLLCRGGCEMPQLSGRTFVDGKPVSAHQRKNAA